MIPSALHYNPEPQFIAPRSSSTALTVSLPHLFTPRDYQTDGLFRPLFPHHYPDLAMLDTPRKKRICLLWHRRAGKDKSVVNAITLAAWEELGNYLYLLPEQTAGKKIIWRGLGGDGVKFIDHIPSKIIKKKYESEMLVELLNGSTVQVGGADNYNSWMGTNPRGIIFSEYSLQDPMAWQHFRPILTENGGWAVFIYTARGKNHGYTLYNTALAHQETWACSKMTIEDTKREDGSPVITHAQYLQEIEDGMPESLALQEFYCDFDAALIGSYYGDLINKAKQADRMGFFPYDPAKPVYTAYDLGNDANVCIFAQTNGNGVNIIDYFEESNTPFSEMCKVVSEKPYTYATHFFPHDVVNRDHEGNTRIETALNYGIEATINPRASIDDGIEAVRNMLPRCNFNESSTERLIEVLMSYERVWDDKNKTFKERPLHNWASHGSDAFRALAVNSDEITESGQGWTTEELDIDADWVV